jgi:hypothetical protein
MNPTPTCCPNRHCPARGQTGTLNVSPFVEGRRWWPWAGEGLAEARICAGDEPCHGEEIRRAFARFDALQSAIN